LLISKISFISNSYKSVKRAVHTKKMATEETKKEDPPKEEENNDAPSDGEEENAEGAAAATGGEDGAAKKKKKRRKKKKKKKSGAAGAGAATGGGVPSKKPHGRFLGEDYCTDYYLKHGQTNHPASPYQSYSRPRIWNTPKEKSLPTHWNPTPIVNLRLKNVPMIACRQTYTPRSVRRPRFIDKYDPMPNPSSSRGLNLRTCVKCSRIKIVN
jgi:hypothetical protein